MRATGWVVIVVAAGILGVAAFGGPAEPPAKVWVWGSDDGGAPSNERQAREVFEAPGGRRLLAFEARGEPVADGPMGVGLRGLPGARRFLGLGDAGVWRSYRATARSERDQVGTFWEYRRVEAFGR